MSDAYVRYHDEEWGVPVHDDRKQFEFLILEGAQAGLQLVDDPQQARGLSRGVRRLRRRARWRASTSARSRELMLIPGIVRNRLKIESAIGNAQAVLKLQDEFGSFDRYLWSFVGGKPIVNRWTEMKQVPATSAESDALSKDLKQRGFKFVGSTIIYAHMQATGMVNDHLVSCFRYKACKQLK